MPEPLVEVTRGTEIESAHSGSLVVLSPGGNPILTAGDPAAPMFPRSALKPLQAVALVRLGLSLPSPLLALAAASHSGEDFHVDGVRAILSTVGLSESSLENVPGLPYGDDERLHSYLRAGGQPSRIMHNCSGKHAAMVATCATNGWPTHGYCDVHHPLAASILAECADIAGEPLGFVGVDGCGAPAPQLSLSALARAYQRIGTADSESPEGLVASAIRSNPEMVGGTRRDVTDLMQACPGLLAKDGAEGVLAGVSQSGHAFALKLADGASRGRVTVAVAVLRALGITVDESRLQPESVLSGARVVGEIRVSAWLTDRLRQI